MQRHTLYQYRDSADMEPDESGEWVRYDDHAAAIEQLTNRLKECHGQPFSSNPREQSHAFQIEHLTAAIGQLTKERDEARAEVDRLTALHQEHIDSLPVICVNDGTSSPSIVEAKRDGWFVYTPTPARIARGHAAGLCRACNDDAFGGPR